MSLAAAEALIAALRRPGAYPHPVGPVRVIETHISWVLLTGEFAYKLKKPLALGFLDFSTLSARRKACEEELRLNRRLAPELYLDLWPVTGTPEAPRLAPQGPALEWAVRMRQFPDDAVLDRQLAAGQLSLDDMDALGETVADFHRRLEPVAASTPYGQPEQLWAPIAESLDELAAVPGLVASAARLREACRRDYQARRAALAARRTAGAVRECHGDLHLGNLVRLADRITAFDALEFDPALRWTDVVCEVAFLVMDLAVRGRLDLAWRFLNRYLAVSGDYAGLAVLPLCLRYRALVRAKIGALRDDEDDAVQRLLTFAADPLPGPPMLLVTSGLSGSGKTWLARQLADRLPAVHLRSDVERKRLFGLEELAHSGSAPDRGLYAPAATRATYARLLELASGSLRAGLAVIVDATSGRRARRQALIGLAGRLGLPCAVLHCTADPGVLRERVGARARAGKDASEAGVEVLERQFRRFETPAPGDGAPVLVIDTGQPVDVEAVVARLRALSRR